MNVSEDLQVLFARSQRIALIIAIPGTIFLIVGATLTPRQFLQSYLFAYIFWLDTALGCFAIFMLHHLVSGGWGFISQRLLEAGMRTLPFMAVLFIPVLIGEASLYSWMHSTLTGPRHLWVAYLNPTFFLIRTVLYFAIWIGGAEIMTRWSRRQDTQSDPRPTRSLRAWSAPGLIVYVLTMTFASIDWVMSLEPGWFSTIYGFLFVVSQVLSALALVIIALRVLVHYSPLSRIVTERHIHHLGNLLLTFVILWAYMAYSQFIIIWSGNLPDENSWYIRRLTPGWESLGLIIVIAHFFVPFGVLLSRRLKRSIRSLSLIAAGIFVMRLLETFWLVEPAFRPIQLRIQWLDIVAPLALGGIWCSLYIRQLRATSLIPLHDPRFASLLEPAEAL